MSGSAAFLRNLYYGRERARQVPTPWLDWESLGAPTGDIDRMLSEIDSGISARYRTATIGAEYIKAAQRARSMPNFFSSSA